MSDTSFLPLNDAIALAKPPAFQKLKADLKRINEQLHLLDREAGVQRELADPQFSNSLEVRTPDSRRRAAERLKDIDRQRLALTRTSEDTRRQIAEMQGAVLDGLAPLQSAMKLHLVEARDALYAALLDFNAVSVARQEAGAAATILPTRFPHLDELLRQLDLRRE